MSNYIVCRDLEPCVYYCKHNQTIIIASCHDMGRHCVRQTITLHTYLNGHFVYNTYTQQMYARLICSYECGVIRASTHPSCGSHSAGILNPSLTGVESTASPGPVVLSCGYIRFK